VLSNILEHFGSLSENPTLGVLVSTLIRKQLELKKIKWHRKNASCASFETLGMYLRTFPVSQKILEILARLLICVSTAERSLPPFPSDCVFEDLA